MLAIQLWSPDTCGCTVHISYDDALPAAQQVFTVVSEAQAQAQHAQRRLADPGGTNPKPQPPAAFCSRHLALAGLAGHGVAVFDENRRKNITHGIFATQAAALADRFQWAFTDDGVLHVNATPPLTNQQRATIQTVCDTQFGVGKVVVA